MEKVVSSTQTVTQLDSSPHINDPNKLKSVFYEQGFLILRNVLDLKEVRKVKIDIMNILKEHGFINKDEEEPIWTKKEYNETELAPLPTAENCETGKKIAELQSLKDLYNSDRIMNILRNLLGGDNIYVWKDNVERVRVMLPGKKPIIIAKQKAPRFTGGHQDQVFFRFEDNRETPFVTAWIPLMEIDEITGGLVLAKDTHERGLFKHYYGPNGEQRFIPFTEAQRKEWEEEGCTSPVDGCALQGNEEWIRADYKEGDVILFHNNIVHAGLPNLSKKIRISGDFRYQIEGTNMQWEAKHTLSYAFNYYTEISTEIARLGIEKELIPRIMYRIMFLEGPTNEKGETHEKRILDCAANLRKE